MRITRYSNTSILAAAAIGAALLWGGCAPTGGDTPSGSGGAGGRSLATGGAGVNGSGGATGGPSGSGGDQGSGGHDAETGGSSTGGSADNLGTGGQGGQAEASGGAGGSANPDAGTAGGGRAGLGGNGSGGLGGTTGTGTGGAGATSVYNPCPTSGTCKILPFGDSITKGEKSSDSGGYRSPLYKLIVAGKQKVTFTGSRADGPSQVSGQAFPRSHEGHPGWTIDPGYNMISNSYSGISTLVPSPALNGSPNIILLMIGTNDLFARETANMATRLEVLLDKIVQGAPNALIVLATLTPLSNTSANANATAYNAKIPGIVQTRAAKGQHFIGVDMSKLPINQLSDGTHPNDQGYAYMANIWYAAIKDLLPQ